MRARLIKGITLPSEIKVCFFRVQRDFRGSAIYALTTPPPVPTARMSPQCGETSCKEERIYSPLQIQLAMKQAAREIETARRLE
jgi:hypothetical protein